MHQVNSDARQPVADRNIDHTPNLVTVVQPTGPATLDNRALTCSNSSTANGPTDVNETS